MYKPLLKKITEDKRINNKDMAKLLKISEKTLNKILKGEKDLTINQYLILLNKSKNF